MYHVFCCSLPSHSLCIYKLSVIFSQTYLILFQGQIVWFTQVIFLTELLLILFILIKQFCSFFWYVWVLPLWTNCTDGFLHNFLVPPVHQHPFPSLLKIPLLRFTLCNTHILFSWNFESTMLIKTSSSHSVPPWCNSSLHIPSESHLWNGWGGLQKCMSFLFSLCFSFDIVPLLLFCLKQLLLRNLSKFIVEITLYWSLCLLGSRQILINQEIYTYFLSRFSGITLSAPDKRSQWVGKDEIIESKTVF